jgi:hypothetical protein
MQNVATVSSHQLAHNWRLPHEYILQHIDYATALGLPHDTQPWFQDVTDDGGTRSVAVSKQGCIMLTIVFFASERNGLEGCREVLQFMRDRSPSSQQQVERDDADWNAITRTS